MRVPFIINLLPFLSCFVFVYVYIANSVIISGTVRYTTSITSTMLLGIKDTSAAKEEDEEQYEDHYFGRLRDTDLSELSSSTNSFGACLMIMDDNHFLVEWLAYHYHALPLRHITVLIDPKSKTSPIEIFERWRGKMTIEFVSSDQDWNYNGLKTNKQKFEYLRDKTSNFEEVDQFHAAHPKFFEDCMRMYKRRNWSSWIALTDTDEYIAPQMPSDGPKSKGAVMKKIEHNLYEESQANATYYVTPECLYLSRIKICPEDKNFQDVKTTNNSLLPPVVQEQLGLISTANGDDVVDSNGVNNNNMEFATFRWKTGFRYRLGKSLVNIPQVPQDYLEQFDILRQGGDCHQVLPGRQCPEVKNVKVYETDASLDQLNFRDDPRGNFSERVATGNSLTVLQKNKNKCHKIRHKFKAVTPWLQGFIHHVGQDEARKLLADAGRVHSWPAYYAYPTTATT